MPEERAGDGSPEDAWLDCVLAASIVSDKDRDRARTYIEGLCGDRGRKTVRSIAGSSQPKGRVQLQRFLTGDACDDALLWEKLAREAAGLLGGDRACLVVDDVVLLKKGTTSVGVARRADAATGRRCNFQELIALSLAREGRIVPVAMRLVLPHTWTDDPAKRLAARIPEASTDADDPAAYGGDQIVLREVGRLRHLVSFGVVVAPAYCGTDRFREQLATWGIRWVLPIAQHDEFHPRIRKSSDRSGSRVEAKFEAVPKTAFDILQRKTGQHTIQCLWCAKYEPVSAKIDDVSGKRRRETNGNVIVNDRVWIWNQIGFGDKSDWWMSNLPPKTDPVRLVDAIRNQWLCRDEIERVKGKLGLAAYQGRSWVGLHRHALMVCLAALRTFSR